MSKYRTVERVTGAGNTAAEAVTDVWVDAGTFFKGIGESIAQTRFDRQLWRLRSVTEQIKRVHELDEDSELTYQINDHTTITLHTTEGADYWKRVDSSENGQVINEISSRRDIYPPFSHWRKELDADGQHIRSDSYPDSGGWNFLTREDSRQEIKALVDLLT